MNVNFKNSNGYMCEELRGDTLTPIAILQKLKGPKKFLLESSLKHNDEGRYSFIGSDPAFELISYGTRNEIIERNGKKRIEHGNPIDVMKKLMPAGDAYDAHFPFPGGAVGFIGYDIVRQFERIGKEIDNEIGMPDVHLMFYEVVIIFDHSEEKVIITGNRLLKDTSEESIKRKIENIIKELKQPDYHEDLDSYQIGNFRSEITQDEFIKNVEKAKEHIECGDIFQVVLSQRMKAEFHGSPLSLYRKHRSVNPTPYMFFIDFEQYSVVGSSPESLVKAFGNHVTVNPIAGTKKRGRDSVEDQMLEEELMSDEKELAEHRMLVDLGRNDLGRVCEFGTVSVKKYMDVEKYRHVMHLVSEVDGILKNDKNGLDALAACLPAGTVSGAPKVRAMEIINELEISRRGLYSGAVGYLSANGNMDFALAIRTMIIKEGFAYIQAGAGIVHDSNPETEYEETLNKLKSFLEGKK
ncbi:MAG: anthranilate synthase component I [Bacillota bacterium]|nr:anthranilate synthase component I [Bacillota bacterium]